MVVATSSKSLYISAHASNLHAAVNNELEFLNPEEGSNAEKFSPEKNSFSLSVRSLLSL